MTNVDDKTKANAPEPKTTTTKSANALDEDGRKKHTQKRNNSIPSIVKDSSRPPMPLYVIVLARPPITRLASAASAHSCA